jgi:hypothetical protein
MKGIYFVDTMSSFMFGNPEVTEAWKHLIFDLENEGNDVVAFRLPKARANELIISIEKLLKDKLL